MVEVGKVNDKAELGRRDAYHVPAVLVSSDMKIEPGQSVRFIESPANHAVASTSQGRHGIADPFMPATILPGQPFLMFIEPKLVDGKVSHHFKISGVPFMETATAPPDELAKLREEIATLKTQVVDLEEELDNDGCRGCY